MKNALHPGPVNEDGLGHDAFDFVVLFLLMQRLEYFEHVLTAPCHDESPHVASDVPVLLSAA